MENYQEKYLKLEARVNDLEANKKQLQHLLIHIDNHLEDIEGLYDLVYPTNKNEHLENHFSELRSLIEIARSHNESNMNEK